MHVVCVGDLMVDVVTRISTAITPGSDTAAAITMQGGGAAANVASWLSAGGGRSTFVGCIGDDATGRAAVADLEAAGVTVRVAVDPQWPTGTCVVLVGPDGERTMFPDAGANRGLGKFRPDYLLPRAADVLYVSGYALFDPGSRDFALGALALARERGWRIALDAASAAPLRRMGRDSFAGWVGTDVVLFANRDEAEVLAPAASDATGLATELARRFGQAVVKSGADGVVWSDAESLVRVPARPVEIVDTVGAGDACAAGFLATWSGPADVPAALARGVEWASEAVTVRGGRPVAR